MKESKSEFKHTKKQTQKAEADFDKAKILSAHMAELLLAQEETLKQKVIAAGILFAGVAAIGQMPIEIATELLKNVYKNACESVAEGPLQ